MAAGVGQGGGEGVFHVMMEAAHLVGDRAVVRGDLHRGVGRQAGARLGWVSQEADQRDDRGNDSVEAGCGLGQWTQELVGDQDAVTIEGLEEQAALTAKGVVEASAVDPHTRGELRKRGCGVALLPEQFHRPHACCVFFECLRSCHRMVSRLFWTH
ncbi:MAG TPA: hypothetical protein VK726_27390 [Acetobacteraceae bacterium]|nr:hypothetical protein [Acetobacteraceae bacterium]